MIQGNLRPCLFFPKRAKQPWERILFTLCSKKQLICRKLKALVSFNCENISSIRAEVTQHQSHMSQTPYPPSSLLVTFTVDSLLPNVFMYNREGIPGVNYPQQTSSMILMKTNALLGLGRKPERGSPEAQVSNGSNLQTAWELEQIHDCKRLLGAGGQWPLKSFF